MEAKTATKYSTGSVFGKGARDADDNNFYWLVSDKQNPIIRVC